MPDRFPVRPIGAARACPTVRSALPGRVATDVVANHAAPGRAKSSAWRAVLRSGEFSYRTHGIYVAPNGSIFCTDDGQHTVRQFRPEGKLLMTLGVFDTPCHTFQKFSLGA